MESPHTGGAEGVSARQQTRLTSRNCSVEELIANGALHAHCGG